MSAQKKLLLLGGGHSDIPLILSAKKLGYTVFTTGNAPQALGHPHGDGYHEADFFDKEAMLRLAERLGVEALCSCTNDFAALSAAYVAGKLGLPGHDDYETALTLHHKDRYRRFAMDHGVPSPRALGFTDVASALEGIAGAGLRYPLISKPVDLTGGRGVSTIREPAEAEAALKKAFAISRAKRVVVEEFIEGTRHGFSGILRDGKIVFHFIDNEHYYLNPYMVSAASSPARVPASVGPTLCAEAERIAALLSLKTGIFHLQYILRGGEPVIIEICRRAPGDLYIKLVEYATGVDYPSWIVRAAAGLGCEGLSHAAPRGFVLRHCVMAARRGPVRGVRFDPSIEGNIVERMMWWKHGDVIRDELADKLGIVFLRFDSAGELAEKAEAMQQLILAEVG